MSDSILSPEKLAEMPIEVLQRITDELTTVQLRTFLKNESVLTPFAFNSLYRTAYIMHPKENDYSFKGYTYLNFEEELEDIDGHIIHDKWRDYGPAGYEIENCYHFKSVDNFIEFVSRYPGYVPRTLKFERVKTLLDLQKSHSELLAKVKSIEINLEYQRWDDHENQETYVESIKAASSVNYNVRKLTILNFMPIIDYSDLVLPKGLVELEIYRGTIVDKEKFFRNLPNLSFLSLNEVEIKLNELEFLPNKLKTVKFINSLKISEVSNRIELPPKVTNLLLHLTSKGDGSPTYFNLSSAKSLHSVEFNYRNLHSLEEVGLPLSTIDLKLIHCSDLRELRNLNQFYRLRTLKVDGNFSLSVSSTFFVNTNFPESLEELRFSNYTGGLKYKQSIDDAVVENPDHYFEYENQLYFKVGDKFRLPSNLKVLEISNDHSLKIDGSLVLPSSLNYLTFDNCAGFAELEKLKLPPNLVHLELTDMNLPNIENVQFPESLQNLVLHSNNISGISNTNLHMLPKLTRMNLSYNKIGDTSSIDSQLPLNLEILKLVGNNLKNCYLDHLNHLEILDLSYNSFEFALDSEKLRLPENLTILKLVSNRFTDVGGGFKFPRNIREIDLTANGLRSIDSNFVKSLPESVSRIYLGSNSLSVLSEIDISLPNLKLLSLYNCELDSLANLSLQGCERLERMILSSNLLQEIDTRKFPKSIRNLSVQSNELKSIKGDFKGFSEIKNLNLGHNQLGMWIRENELELPKSLLSVELSQNSIDDISKIKWSPNAIVVHLYGNDVNVDQVKQLAELYLPFIPKFRGISINSDILSSNNELEKFTQAGVLRGI
ncbi:uncharacterized protein RJT20DRAFT_132834 [Scheffersomyces xylosifermentans]|uniref:uncharacterized protein n=1 Tax=Scheffersomyces xylosifermentans TaxID=1304137 RepID=UPI00315D1F52